MNVLGTKDLDNDHDSENDTKILPKEIKPFLNISFSKIYLCIMYLWLYIYYLHLIACVYFTPVYVRV